MPRSIRSASAPSRSGSPRSSTIRSGASAATRRSASRAVPVACTVWPRSVSDRISAPRTTWSSSTSSTVAMVETVLAAARCVGAPAALFVLAWVVATAVSVGGSWVGLQPVLPAADRQTAAGVVGVTASSGADTSLRPPTARGDPSPTVTVSPTPGRRPSPSPTRREDELPMWRRAAGVWRLTSGSSSCAAVRSWSAPVARKCEWYPPLRRRLYRFGHQLVANSVSNLVQFAHNFAGVGNLA